MIQYFLLQGHKRIVELIDAGGLHTLDARKGMSINLR